MGSNTQVTQNTLVSIPLHYILKGHVVHYIVNHDTKTSELFTLCLVMFLVNIINHKIQNLCSIIQ